MANLSESWDGGEPGDPPFLALRKKMEDEGHLVLPDPHLGFMDGRRNEAFTLTFGVSTAVRKKVSKLSIATKPPTVQPLGNSRRGKIVAIGSDGRLGMAS